MGVLGYPDHSVLASRILRGTAMMDDTDNINGYPEIKGLKISTGKDLEEVIVKGYEDYRDAVDGMIEAVSLRFPIIYWDNSDPSINPDTPFPDVLKVAETVTVHAVMWVNEEFTYKWPNTPNHFNSIATDIAGMGGRADILLTGIKGPVLLTGPTDQEGYSTDLDDAVVILAKRIQREARLGEN